MKRNYFPGLLLCALACAHNANAQKLNYEPYTISTIAGWGSNEHTVDGPPATAEFADPQGIAVDKDGNIYVAEVFGQTIRKVTPDGVASTFAGEAGEPGSADGKGEDARFSNPEGVAIGPDGTIYVADYSNNTIRKITHRGVVTTLAGSPGLSGFVDGVGSAARFNGPYGIAVNSSGDIFVADSFNYAIRKITADGTVTTFAGGTRGSQNGTGTAAQFDWPWDIAVDKLGNLYVVENYLNFDVRKITPDAVVTTLASAEWPNGVVVDNDLNVYVTNGTVINKISPSGEMTDFVGSSTRLGSEDGKGADAEFAFAMRIAIDRHGNFYVTDAHDFWAMYSNETIRKITPKGVVTTLSGVADSGSQDGVGENARLFWPRGVAVDATETTYVADSQNDTIRKIAPDETVTTIAGKVQVPGYVDGSATDARFNSPGAVALDSAGDLFIADTGNNVIRELTPEGQVSTVASGHVFNSPNGVTVDGSGNIYVAVTGDQTIDKITPGGSVSVLAGSTGHSGYADGTGTKARFDSPSGISADSAGNIYVADTDNDAIRKITPEAVVTTLAGGALHGAKDGTGSAAAFRSPGAVSVDSAGNVFVSDTGNSILRKVTPAGVTTTLAGSPEDAGWVDDTGEAARFSSPAGIGVSPAGCLYVADTYNNTIRKGIPAGANKKKDVKSR